MTDNNGNQFSFWYLLDPFTCAIMNSFIFKDEVLTFKGFSLTKELQSAVAYRTPGVTTTDELLLGYNITSETMTMKVSMTVQNDDHVRPNGLLYHQTNHAFIIAKNNIRRLNIQTLELTVFPLQSIQHGVMESFTTLFVGS